MPEPRMMVETDLTAHLGRRVRTHVRHDNDSASVHGSSPAGGNRLCSHSARFCQH